MTSPQPSQSEHGPDELIVHYCEFCGLKCAADMDGSFKCYRSTDHPRSPHPKFPRLGPMVLIGKGLPVRYVKAGG